MGGLKSIISPPKPKIPELPKVPDQAAIQAEERRKADAELDEKRKRQRGRGATLLTGGQGVEGDDSYGLATRTLLGG